jgi:Flp pilus assembly pilin Flp
MRYIKNRLAELFNDEAGGEIMEYVIVAGLITIAAVSVIGAFGTKVVAKWTSVNNSL